MQSLARIRLAYQQLLGHPAVSMLACIPQKAIKLKMPDAWQTRESFSRHAKEDMLLFNVANSQGLRAASRQRDDIYCAQMFCWWRSNMLQLQ